MLSQPAAFAGTHSPWGAGEFLAVCSDVRSSLSRSRYRHVLGVARTAERLARRYGNSTYKARVAAIMHDIARGWKPAELVEYALKNELFITPAEQVAPILLHSRVGAHIARTRYGVDDREILGAIERHTVAVPGMSNLEKIVYIADAIEPSRSFPQRAALAAAADRSLDEGLLACITASTEYLNANGVSIAPQTAALYSQLVQHREAAS